MTTNNTTPENNKKDQTSSSKNETDTAKATTAAAVNTQSAKKEQVPADYDKLQKQAKKGVRLGSLAIIISILLSGGVTVYTQQHYQSQIATLQAQLQQSQVKLNQQISDSVKQTESITQNVVNKTETSLAQQHKSIESLQLALSEVQGRRPNDWLLAESDYLVKLAGRKLFLEHDPESATLLMESADQRIATLNDPNLLPLRKVMAKDITTLKSIPLVDVNGLVLRLNALSSEIDKLPLANAILPEAVEVKKEQVTDDVNNWKSNLLTSAKSFADKFITFRTRDGNAIPLLSPEQHFFLRENLKLKLETATQAIYDGQQEIYTSALKTAVQWSTSYFNQGDNRVVEFEHSIKQLGEKTIQVTYPMKIQSQEALTEVINQRLRRSVTSLTTEDKE